MAVTRPELGPTLPGALRERFGIPPVVTLAVAGVVAAARRRGDPRRAHAPARRGEQVVHRGAPVFNMLYPGDAMHVGRAGLRAS